jgi:dolichol-phosphate mannosyltransferase
VTVIDADLQDPPELIPQMIDLWRHGADIVFAVRETRAGESAFKKLTASAYYRILRRLASTDIPVDTGDFRLMSRRAAEGLRVMREHNRYVRGLAGWMGLKREIVVYQRDPRYAGETKYPLRKMLRLASDGVLSFSMSPLRLATVLGALSAGLSLVVIVWAIVVRLTTDSAVPGWASTIVSVLFIGGAQLLMTGVIGEYLGRVYDEVRARPIYLVDEVRGFGNELAEHFRQSPVPPAVGASWPPTQ